MRRKLCIGLVVALIVFAAFLFDSGKAFATLEQMKIIKGVYPGKDKYSCQLCHVDKLPKKDAHEHNAYGKKAVEAAGGAGHKATAEIYTQLGDPEAAK